MKAFLKSRVALLWIVFFNFTSSITAQETTRLEQERIRVTWAPPVTAAALEQGVQIRPITAVGSFVSLTTDSLTFEAEQGNQITAVAVSEISRLEISRRGSRARQGLFVGLISGATLGVLAGIGGGIGALVGSAMSGEHWETIAVPEVARGS
jgi:hypothetical protein